MKAGVDKHTQVRDLVSMILHEKTKGIAAEIVATDKKAKKSLRHALAKIGERMALLGTLTQTSMMVKIALQIGKSRN